MKISGAEAIKSYLLGNLDEPRRSQLEERLLNDGELFEELLISEDELVDNYVAGRLNEIEKKRFESHFLITPDRHRKFQFGRTLNKYLELNETNAQPIVSFEPRGLFKTQRPFWPIRQTVIAFLLIALLGVGSFVLYRTLVRTNVDSPPIVVSLVPGATRSTGSGLHRISVPSETGVIELRLAVPATKYQTYLAEFSSDQGKVTEIRSSKILRQDGESIVFSVPARSLPPNDYQVKLSGIGVSGEREMIDTYSFGILPR